MLDSGNSCFIRLPFQAWDYLAEMYAFTPPGLSAGITAAFGERLWGRGGFRQNGCRLAFAPLLDHLSQVGPRRDTALAAGFDHTGEEHEDPRALLGSGALADATTDHPVP